MTQQPGGWGQPQQQQGPPQGQWGQPPQQQGPPQGQFPSGGYNQGQQGPPPAMQAATNPTAASGGFFGGMQGGGDATPSFKWGSVGDVVQGTIVSADVMEVTEYGRPNKVIDHNTGQPAQQLRIVLQTELRNWDRCAKVPTTDDGAQLPPSEDDGKRAIYTGGKRTDGRSWMSGAINDALAKAGRDPAKGLEVGAMLGVFVEKEVPTENGNPYRTYQAKYASPGQAQQQPQQQAAPQQQAPQNVTQQPGYGGPQQGYQQPQQQGQDDPWAGASAVSGQRAPQGQQAPPQQQGDSWGPVGDPWGGYQAPQQQAPQQPSENPFANAGGNPPF